MQLEKEDQGVRGVVCLGSSAHAPSLTRVVQATNRGIDDLDVRLWLAFTFVSCALRLGVQHPFVVAMTRQQAAGEASPSTTTRSAVRPSSSTRLLRALHRRHGVRALFRGYGTLALSISVAEIAYMWLFEFLRNASNRDTNPLTRWTTSQAVLDGSAGFIADVLTTVFCVPFGLVANRQMCAGVGVATKLPYESAVATFRRVYAAAGLVGAYRGTTPALLMSTQSFVWWAAYGVLKEAAYTTAAPRLQTLRQDHPRLPTALVSPHDNVVVNAACGAVTGATVGVAWNPVNVVRTRMQVDASGTGAVPTARQVARAIWRAEGAAGFRKGAAMFAVSNAVDAAAFCVLYEFGKQLAQRVPSTPAS